MTEVWDSISEQRQKKNPKKLLSDILSAILFLAIQV